MAGARHCCADPVRPGVRQEWMNIHDQRPTTNEQQSHAAMLAATLCLPWFLFSFSGLSSLSLGGSRWCDIDEGDPAARYKLSECLTVCRSLLQGSE